MLKYLLFIKTEWLENIFGQNYFLDTIWNIIFEFIYSEN